MRMMRTRKSSNPDPLRSGFPDRFRAGAGRGPGRQYVVNQKHPPSPHALRLRHIERTSDISPSLRRAQSRLRRRIPHAHAVLHAERNLPQSRNLRHEQFRLIEAALPLPFPVERNRNRQVERLLRQPLRGLQEKPPERLRQRTEPIVFEPLDERP